MLIQLLEGGEHGFQFGVFKVVSNDLEYPPYKKGEVATRLAMHSS